MPKWLKRHPFPVEAFFERVLAVSFAFPADLLEPLAPPPLEIDTFGGYGFVTVALVRTRGLRPAGFPAGLGQDFFLAGYRVFARLRDGDGRRLRGLKILRSETDKARMVFSGNLLTHYNYRRIRLAESPGRIVTTLPGGSVTLDLGYDEREDAGLPAGSPFPDWRTARRFAGPMPFTFDHEGGGRFVVVEGKRADWTPHPVEITGWRVGLFDETPFAGVEPVLANAFMVRNVPYRWERGRVITPGPGKEDAGA